LAQCSAYVKAFNNPTSLISTHCSKEGFATMTGLWRSFSRHALVAGVAVVILAFFWVTRRDWSPEHRIWRATGDVSLVLLFLTLVIGPLARLYKPVVRANPWRRELGIWSAVYAVIHTVVILNGWIRWDLMRFLGYEFNAPLERFSRLEPGFGLSNIVGAVALLISVVLMVTSTDRALQALGGSAWKWLHYSAYTVFYLSGLHTAYFLFMHFTASFHREAAPENWFRVPFLLMVAGVLVIQFAAFQTEVRRRSERVLEKSA
jgi:methionine sulfoxide reductase heme-binding subunit